MSTTTSPTAALRAARKSQDVSVADVPVMVNDFVRVNSPNWSAPSGDDRRFIDDHGFRRVIVLFSQPSRATRTVGKVAVVENEMFVLVGDVVHEQP